MSYESKLKKLRQETKNNINNMYRKLQLNREFYDLRSVLGNDWAMFYILLGGREAGKSYATTDFFCKQWLEYKRPFYWIRLTDTSAGKLLVNNAEKLIDPDIRRKYNLDITTNGDAIYQVLKRDANNKVIEKVQMARVLNLSTFYNDKGSGLFDKDFLLDPNMYYNICLDEMNREKNEKRTFDILYAFVNQLENLARSTKNRIRVIMIGNTLEEASDIMCGFNFIPEQFGRYKLVKNKKLLIQYLKELKECPDVSKQGPINEKYKNIDFGKRAVVEYIEPSEKYTNRRKGTIADILMPKASTFTNEIEVDTTLVYKGRLNKPLYVIKFSKDESDWFTLWNNNIIAQYHGENKPVIAMTPYIDEVFDPKRRDSIMLTFDVRAFKYRNLITFKLFQKRLELLKPRR